jgi:hypothetical protein
MMEEGIKKEIEKNIRMWKECFSKQNGYFYNRILFDFCTNSENFPIDTEEDLYTFSVRIARRSIRRPRFRPNNSRLVPTMYVPTFYSHMTSFHGSITTTSHAKSQTY